MRQVTVQNVQEFWAFGPTHYVRAAVENIEEHLGNKGEKLAAKSLTPLSSKYCPRVDISEELAGEEVSYYQSLIDVLRWILELCRADIRIEVSMMSPNLALPQRGHLDEVLHIFAYLKSHANSEMVYDPSGIEFDRSEFSRKYWRYFIYTQDGCQLLDNLPKNMPKPRGKVMVMMIYVDIDQVGDTVTRRSRERGFYLTHFCTNLLELKEANTVKQNILRW